MSNYYILEDWMGNHLHLDKTFESFYDGWCFIDENYDEVYYDDLFIIEKTNTDEVK
jgi:hypothetical protein